MSDDRLVAHRLSVGYRGARARVLASGIDFAVAPGEAWVILGPNGAGKTTLLRTLLGLNEPLAGHISIAGRDAVSCSRRERARWLAYVPQARRFEFAFRVLDLVAMGCAPRLSVFALPSSTEYLLAQRALDQLGIGHLADADEPQLSGGEQQLVLIARALVQQTRFLLLDEPTANLDLGNQLRVLEQVVGLRQSGLGVIMISHAPAHAFACATHVALFDRRGGFSAGAAHELLTEERLSAVYEVPVRIATIDTPRGAVRTCVAVSGAL